MKVRVIPLLLIVMSAPLAAAQHDAHDAQASAGDNPQQVSVCAQSQQAALGVADAANRRIELARQTNQPAAMRAAIDDLQAALSAIRTQLASCAQFDPAVASADPHAGHTMNITPGNVKDPVPATAATAGKPPGSAAPAPGAPAADAHAGHTMPAPAPSAPAAPGADTHAGHTTPSAPARGAASKSTAPPKSTPGRGTKAPAAPDPHAGHAMPQAVPQARVSPGSAPRSSQERTGGPLAVNQQDSHAGHAMISPPATAAQAVDPVCGLKVDRAGSPQATYQGQTYSFCSEQHRQLLVKDPVKYVPKVKQ